MPWKFEVLGETFHERELTLDQYIDLEESLGVDYKQIHPLRSAKQARQIAAQMYSDRCKVSLESALTEIGKTGAVQFVETIDLHEDETSEGSADPPKADQAATTS